eukprot:TRINITY_DN4680_c0_g1_i1.p1 TRINITY_DN4680_c0_g1~~TRINITY_DN4680_c0_g1_i1.p1  ORF type:complete len:937 (+),score=167.18 TRINITY_DN4680_c0_g1_i1:240-2813(+)
MKDKQKHLVAISEEVEEIHIHWGWLEENILPLAKEHANDDKEDLFLYLKIKFEVMAAKVSTDLENAKEVFASLFSLPNEKLITVYNCSLWNNFHRHGQMYITNNYTCFHYPPSNEKITIPFKDITLFQKQSAYGGDNSIVIKTSSQTYTFCNLIDRDKVFSLLDQLWNLAMQRVIQTTENLTTNVLPESTPRYADDFDDEDLGYTLSDSLDTEDLSMSALEKRITNDEFNSIFRLPHEDLLIDQLASLLLKRYSIRGRIYVSPNFASFRSTNSKICVVLPLREVRSIKSVIRVDGKNVIILIAKGRKYSFLVSGFEQVYKNLTEAKQEHASKEAIANSVPEPVQNELPVTLYQHLLSEFSPEYEANQKGQLILWKQYFKRFGKGVCMIEVSTDIRNLVRGGIPDHLRGTLWQYFSGATFKFYSVHPGYYHGLMKKFQDKESKSTEEIEKDLSRSFPYHPYYQTEEGIDALRNVLTTYSWRNAKVGYCQSLNIVCALLLLYVSQQGAFWLLSSLCENMVPENYSKQMIGSVVDQRILEQLVQTHLPQVYQHLSKVKVPLTLITQPWILCLFIGYLPFEITLNILDSFFFEGPTIILAVSLAIFKRVSEKILEQDQPDVILSLLRQRDVLNHPKLLKTAFKFADKISPEQLQKLRISHKSQVIKNLEEDTRWNQIYELQGKTKFGEEELKDLFYRYSLQLSSGSHSGLDYKSYQNIFVQIIPNWQNRSDLVRAAFQHADVAHKEQLDFAEFAISLSTVCKGSSEERIKMCFDLLDTDKDDLLNLQELQLALDGFIRLESQDTSPLKKLGGFVSMILDKDRQENETLVNENEHKINFSRLKQQILDQPLLEEFIYSQLSF